MHSVSPAMLRALHAAARKHGLDHEQLRSLAGVPSLRQLSVGAAIRMLDQLNAGQPSRTTGRTRHRRRPGTIGLLTPAQRSKIDRLMAQMGMSPVQSQAWLSARHLSDGRPMTQANTTRDGAEVIELLKGVLSRQRKAGRA